MTAAPQIRLPGASDRTTVIGRTGSGKTIFGAWLLSRQRIDKRPWLVLDYKRETFFDTVGFPPIREIRLGDKLPRKPGLYLAAPRPDEDDAVEDLLWRVFDRENIGLFCDEAALMPDGAAWRAILQQGRAKRIPVIACTQRPVDVKRGLFSEATFMALFALNDRRDYKIVEGFMPGDLGAPLPERHCRFYDVAKNRLAVLAPVPHPDAIADDLRARLPRTTSPLSAFFRNAPAPDARTHGVG